MKLAEDDGIFLRLLEFSPFQQRPGGWRFGTKRISDGVVERLIASGAARREGALLHPVPPPKGKRR